MRAICFYWSMVKCEQFTLLEPHSQKCAGCFLRHTTGQNQSDVRTLLNRLIDRLITRLHLGVTAMNPPNSRLFCGLTPYDCHSSLSRGEAAGRRVDPLIGSAQKATGVDLICGLERGTGAPCRENDVGCALLVVLHRVHRRTDRGSELLVKGYVSGATTGGGLTGTLFRQRRISDWKSSIRPT